MSTSVTSDPPRISWRQRLFPTWQATAWPIVYAATVLALLGWYELWPRVRVQRELQGTWQLTAGKDHEEKGLPSYWDISGGETRVYGKRSNAPDSDWDVRKSSIKVRPSRDFFVVTRNYSLGKPGRSYERDYVICLHDDKFYIVNGIGQISPATEYQISMLRRVNELPADLQQQISSTK